MAPNDRPTTSTPPMLNQLESPVNKNEYNVYLHTQPPFVRYENVHRSTSHTPSQGHTAKLPGVATLLRRHYAMQTNGITIPTPDLNFDLKASYSPDTNSGFECWTPSRFAGKPSSITSPESKWIPLTAALDTTQSYDWNRNTHKYVSKSNAQAHESWTAGTKTSSPAARSPEPVHTTTESRPKTSRYLREIDRRRILLRIAQGEKQSALAKEYHVSRAAICNLNKHRAEVLSRNHEHPLAKHPKRRMLSKPKRDSAMDNQAIASDSSSR
ncbi:unnamed protein product [Phytophthora fragariaefolia]|uniref:Unnamed protein product n=1 Tax=Phytophthora fragariaefolia TaxID=1490495 RepID=A0A9W6TSC4_9STRA|nr:unnamed protein product [Phytophthora fragariaefolia]